MNHRSGLAIKIAKLLLCFNLFVVESSFGQGTVSDSVEYLALKALYESTDGDNWVNNSGWDMGLNPATVTYQDFNSWYGVTAISGDITQLRLEENDLNGYLPSEIFELSQLTQLRFANNSIDSLPSSHGNLPLLNELDLEYNNLDFGDLDFFYQDPLGDEETFVKYYPQNRYELTVTEQTLIVPISKGLNGATSWSEIVGPDEVLLPGLTSDTLRISDVPHIPGDSYQSLVTNTDFPDLFIYSEVATFANGLSVDDIVITEGPLGNTTGLFSVSLDVPYQELVQVDYTLLDSTAVAGEDFQYLSGSLVFNPGETTKTVEVSTIGDELNEPDEIFKLQLQNPINASIYDSMGLATITNDDPIPSLIIADVTQDELNTGSSVFSFEITLNTVSGQTVTVEAATEDGTARVLDGDYLEVASTNVTFNPGETVQTLDVVVNGDTETEPDENFFINLSNAINAIISDNQAIATILSDDISSACTMENTNISNTAQNDGWVGQSFVANCNAPLQNIKLIANSDNSGAGLVMSFYEGEGTSGALLGTVSGIGFPASNDLTDFQSIDFSNEGINLVAGNVYTFAFSAGTVRGIAMDAGANFSNGQTYYNSFPIPSFDLLFKVEAGIPASPELSLSTSEPIVNEDGGQPYLVAELSEPAAEDVIVNLSYSGTAVRPDDYNAVNVFSIAAGSLKDSISIDFKTDAEIEPDETVIVSIASITNATEAGGVGSQEVTFTFLNDDPNQGVVLDSIEYLALKAIYENTDGVNWYEQTNWDLSLDPSTVFNTDFSNWFGVTVTDGDITAIAFSENGLSGQFPAEIGNLTELTSLRLSGEDLAVVPNEIGNLTNLTELYLTEIGITAVPQSIGNLVNLTTLDVTFNELATLPTGIGNLVNLITLDVNTNQLTSLPGSIGNLTSLETLNLEVNQINTLPTEIGNLSSLIVLQAGENQLTSIPSTIGNLTSLQNLSLGINQLSSIPVEVGNLPALTGLDLGNNQLTSIPAEIGNLNNLLGLTLNDNQLSTLPPEIGNLSQLRNLYATRNTIASLPDEIGNLSNLVRLYVSFNDLQSIPSSYATLTSMENLLLDRNMITSLPPGISDLPNLQQLHLRDNKLSFDDLESYFSSPSTPKVASFSYIPQDSIPLLVGDNGDILYVQDDAVDNFYQWYRNGSLIAGASNDSLNINDITHASGDSYYCVITNTTVTGLTLTSQAGTFSQVIAGNVPDNLEYLALKALYESTNGDSWTNNSGWDMTLDPATFTIQDDLQGQGWFGVVSHGGLDITEISLINNNLNGPIPPEFGYLTELKVINLYSNQINGDLPEEFGNLGKVEIIRIYNNDITGLPSTFGNLDSLVEILAQDNQISSLPASVGDLQNIETLTFYGNNISSIPTAIGDLSTLTNLSLAANNISIVPDEIGQLSNLQYLTLYGNNLSDLPASLSNIPGLEILHVGSNNFGEIPAVIFDIGSLQSLIINDNNISVVSGSIGDLSNLEILHLENNQISSLPPEIQALLNVHTLQLQNNQLSELPGSFGAMASLKYLYLHGNNLTTLPAQFGDLAQLEVAQFYENQLTSLPAEIGNLSNLKELHLNGNQLTEIPGTFNQLGALTDLPLQDNELMSIPADLGDLPNINRIWLARNGLGFDDLEPYFSGPGVPKVSSFVYAQQDSLSASATSSTITVLGGGANGVYQWYQNGAAIIGATSAVLTKSSVTHTSGDVYHCEVTNTVVTGLTLYSKNSTFQEIIQVTVPDSIEYLALKALYESTDGDNWTNNAGWDITLEPSTVTAAMLNSWHGITVKDGDVSRVVLQNNNLTGTIPDLEPLDRLEILNLSKNNLSGNIPNMFEGLGELITVSLNDNNLTGPIPERLYNVTTLENLHLHKNSLDGNLSPAIVSWTNLIRLDLFDNQFTGALPAEIESLYQVEYLRLHKNGFTGPIPLEIGNLPNLIQLNLSQNELTGDVPDVFGSMQFLKLIRLNNNNLTGELPLSLFTLTQIENLHLGQNQFTGTIPTAVGNLVNLKAFEVHVNELTGSIPVEISNLSQLEILRLNNNSLSGTVPAELGSLAELNILQLQNNDLSGDLPAELANLDVERLLLQNNTFTSLPAALAQSDSLELLNALNNSLNFEDLESFFDTAGVSLLPDLRYNLQLELPMLSSPAGDILYVGDNAANNSYQWFKNNKLIDGATNDSLMVADVDHTSGSIYRCEITNAKVPGLILKSENGTFPAFVDQVSDNVEYLALKALYDSLGGANWTDATGWDLTLNPDSVSTDDLDAWFGIKVADGDVIQVVLPDNNLTGKIPAAIGDLSTLQVINFSKNNLTDNLPDVFSSMSELITFRLDQNALNGDLPSSIYELTSLTNLYLSKNQFTGSISPAVGNFTELVRLDLFTNNFLGDLPVEIGSLSNLVHLKVNDNGFAGQIPTSFAGLVNLKVFNLSKNNLSGEVPDIFGGMNDITTLALNNNNFTGEVPLSVYGLTTLVTLNIFQNSFTGSLPPDIGNLTNLVRFNLHYNNLSGEIPNEVGNMTALETLKFSHNAFSGDLPASIGNLTNLKVLQMVNAGLSGDLPSGLGNLTNATNMLFNKNNFTSFPEEVASLPALATLNVMENNLNFGDIEPFFDAGGNTLINNYKYKKQGLTSLSLSVDGDILFITDDAENSQYQWYQNGQLLAGAQDDSLRLTDVTNVEGDLYHCVINNTLITDLTITSTEASFILSPGNQFDQVIVGNRTGSVPASSLWVDGNPAAQVYLDENSGTVDENVWKLSTNNNQLSIGTASDDLETENNAILFTRGEQTSVSCIKLGDKVGVGTDYPDSELTVAGEIHTQEFRIAVDAGTVPDYVFSQTYNLLTQEEVEAYIKEHKHLPNIKSAEEYGEIGTLDLGELSLKMLEKVEELTLYVIKNNNRIKELEEKIGSEQTEENTEK